MGDLGRKYLAAAYGPYQRTGEEYLSSLHGLTVRMIVAKLRIVHAHLMAILVGCCGWNSWSEVRVVSSSPYRYVDYSEVARGMVNAPDNSRCLRAFQTSRAVRRCPATEGYMTLESVYK